MVRPFDEILDTCFAGRAAETRGSRSSQEEIHRNEGPFVRLPPGEQIGGRGVVVLKVGEVGEPKILFARAREGTLSVPTGDGLALDRGGDPVPP